MRGRRQELSSGGVFRAEHKCLSSKANKPQLPCFLCLWGQVCINPTLCTFTTSSKLPEPSVLFVQQQGKDVSSCFEQGQPPFPSCNLLMLKKTKRTLQECGHTSQLSQSLKQQAVKMPDSNVTFKHFSIIISARFLESKLNKNHVC